MRMTGGDRNRIEGGGGSGGEGDGGTALRAAGTSVVGTYRRNLEAIQTALIALCVVHFPCELESVRFTLALKLILSLTVVRAGLGIDWFWIFTLPAVGSFFLLVEKKTKTKTKKQKKKINYNLSLCKMPDGIRKGKGIAKLGMLIPIQVQIAFRKAGLLEQYRED